MFEGATENDPLLRATTIKFEQRYAHQKQGLQRSLVLLLVILALVFVFDIARLILRRDTYDAGNDMLPQAIMVAIIAAFVIFFKKREKTSLLVVVYITVVVLFFLFSLAILPSFIKEIIIDFDILCPVMIGLTGLTALICVSWTFIRCPSIIDVGKIICIFIAYRFLKFHRKYMKRKATLPAVLHASPQWQNPYVKRESNDLTNIASVLFPNYQPDPKVVQEQWEKFQQSRLYLPEPRSPRPRPTSSNPTTPTITTLLGPSPTIIPAPPAPTPGGQPTFTAQERWERFQRSPIFHSVNQTSSDASPEIGRARKRTITSPPQLPLPSHPPLTHSASGQLPTPSPAVLPDSSTDHRPVALTITPHIADVTTQSALPPPQIGSRTLPPRLARNPSFRYGAYLHEPTYFRAHPDDTPEEYTTPVVALTHTTTHTHPQQLTQETRGESLPNISTSFQSKPDYFPPDAPIPLELDAFASIEPTKPPDGPTFLYANLTAEISAHRNTENSAHRNTEISAHRNAEISTHRNAEISAHRNNDRRLSLPAQRHAQAGATNPRTQRARHDETSQEDLEPLPYATSPMPEPTHPSLVKPKLHGIPE